MEGSSLKGNFQLIPIFGSSNEQLDRHEDETMMKFLLGNTEISPIVAKYLKKTMELRDFLVDSPKQLS